jgi:hypothetical protein
MFTTMKELNGVLKRNPRYNYGRLRLDNYLVLVAENEVTDDCLTRLEDNGHLPLTVAWFSQEARKARIYQRAEEFQTGYVNVLGLSMSVLTGAEVMCLVASPLNRRWDYDDLRDNHDSEDESLLRVEPAALNQQALKVLRSLILLTDCLSFDDRW